VWQIKFHTHTKKIKLCFCISRSLSF
jgi:hypothetical protein